MKEILEKLFKIKEKIISEKEGVLNFFGLISRPSIENKWDLLVSADWIAKSNSEIDLIYIIDHLKTEFNTNLDFLSRIVLLTPNEYFIHHLLKAISNEIGEENTGIEEHTSLKVFPDLTVEKVVVLAKDFTGIDFNTEEKLEKEPVAIKEF